MHIVKMLSLQTDLCRPSTTSDSWGRYYTADWISRYLVGEMHINQPRIIVELGAGRGALATAAGAKWDDAKIVTVDMDQASVHFLDPLAKRKLNNFTHFIHDALDDNLANQIGIPLGSVDVAVCNPPYVRPRWRSSFSHILEDAGLSSSLKSIHDAGADLLFIAQNLRLLRNGGKLGLVLPDGLITAEKYAGVRKSLLREHCIEKVIKLPRRVFSGTEAQTYLAILSKKRGETRNIILDQISLDGTHHEPISITADLAEIRLDYTYHASAINSSHSSNAGDKYIREMVLNLKRGTISSNQIPKCDWPVFHLSDFSTTEITVPNRFQLSTNCLREIPDRIKIAMPGDILIARIGRNLHEKIAVVQDAPCIISDCIFALRAKDQYRKKILSFLTSTSGRDALSASTHGVGAKYLTSTDILNLSIARHLVDT